MLSSLVFLGTVHNSEFDLSDKVMCAYKAQSKIISFLCAGMREKYLKKNPTEAMSSPTSESSVMPD